MTEIIVKHGDSTHNLSKFLKYHPGGSSTIKHYNGLDVANQLKKVQHSPSAYKLLEDYKVKEDNVTEPVVSDDSLEKLVDWNKAMFWQVGSLGEKYNEWVLSPVDRKLRLFQWDIMEFLTITPWFLVPSVWIPGSSALMYLGYTRILATPYAISSIYLILTLLGCMAVIGYFIWPFIEYCIHRWIFHMDPPHDSPLLITLHFTLHGLHHKVPFDDQRLLFPPVPAALVVWFFYSIFSKLLPEWVVPPLIAGGILGYVTYDLIHYHLHYGSPKDGSYLYFMKRYHNQHHFTQHTSGYGISCPIWDYVFGTVIKLKKLSYSLKW